MRDDGAIGGDRRVGEQKPHQASPTAPPTSWAPTNRGAEPGAMPAKVSENIRPMVTAGLANEVELVNQYAAPM